MRYHATCLLSGLLSSALAVACSERSTLPLDPGAPALATSPTTAMSALSSCMPDVDNICTPAVEAIDFEGIIHGQGSTWDNDHFKSHYNVSFTGVDANGVKYVGASTGNGKGEFPGSETEDVVISTVVRSRRR